MKRYKGRSKKRKKGKQQKNRLFQFFIVIALAIGGFLYQNQTTILPASGELLVHYIDVGQGDATLIEWEGHFILIDAGETSAVSTVSSYLKDRGVDSLDLVVATHPHSDHIGGLPEVLGEFPAKELWMSAVPHDTAAYYHLLEAADNCGANIRLPDSGEVWQAEAGGGILTLTIVSTGDLYGNDLNNASLAIRMVYGSTAFLFLGDAEAEAEYDICESGASLDAQVLKVPHHGSSTSTTEQLLKTVSPDYAVISVGANNDYGHPTEKILNRLEDFGIPVYRTDLSGSITISSDGNEIIIRTGISLICWPLLLQHKSEKS